MFMFIGFFLARSKRNQEWFKPNRQNKSPKFVQGARKGDRQREMDHFFMLGHFLTLLLLRCHYWLLEVLVLGAELFWGPNSSCQPHWKLSLTETFWVGFVVFCSYWYFRPPDPVLHVPTLYYATVLWSITTSLCIWDESSDSLRGGSMTGNGVHLPPTCNASSWPYPILKGFYIRPSEGLSSAHLCSFRNVLLGGEFCSILQWLLTSQEVLS